MAHAEAAFAPVAATSGMRGAGESEPRRSQSADWILALIRQLKSAALTAADWRSAYETLPAAARAARGFTPVFEAYDNLLTARGLADRHDREFAALGLLHRMEQASRRPQYLIGVESLLVAEIYDLSLLQFMTVAALIRIIGDAQLTIQAEPHKVDANRFADLTWNRFAGEESIADHVLPEFVRAHGASGRLGFVIEQLFTGSYPPPPGSGHHRHRRRGAESAGRGGGRGAGDSPVAGVRRRGNPARSDRDRGAGSDALPRLSRGRVSALPDSAQFYALGQPLRAASPARALLELIAIPLEDYRRDALLALCAGPYARPAAELPARCSTKRAISTARRGTSRNASSGVGALDGAGDPPPEMRAGHANQLERLRRGARAWAELLDALATLEPPATLRDHLERLMALLGRIGFDPTAGALTGEGAPGAAACGARSTNWRPRPSRVAPRRTLTLREFAVVLETVLRETAVNPLSRKAARSVRSRSETRADSTRSALHPWSERRRLPALSVPRIRWSLTRPRSRSTARCGSRLARRFGDRPRTRPARFFASRPTQQRRAFPVLPRALDAGAGDRALLFGGR